MNLALQKRHEQLERWRQNEESAEDEKLAQQTQVSSEQDDNSYIQRTKARQLFESPSSDRQDSINSKGSKSYKKQSKSNSDLQVKFSDSTLFLNACANGDLGECQRLLGANTFDINVTTGDGLTGLHEAAICGNANLVELLLESGADINCCDNEGWTPLHAAASLGQLSIVEMLIEYGADLTIVNCENLLAYDLARNQQVQEVIGKHLQGVDIELLHSQEERAIQRDIERWIKTSTYDERSHPVTNATVLHVIAAKGYVYLLKQILENPILKKQINLEAEDYEGYTPLLAASFWQQKEVVELLIEHGANIFAQAKSGFKISSLDLKNYQQSKLDQPNKPQTWKRSSLQSLDSSVDSSDTRRSTSRLDSSASDITCDDTENVTSSNVSENPKHGQLSKSQSLDISKQPPDSSSTLLGSLSVDRLLSRSESMTERELRRCYKDLVMENERLKRRLQEANDREKEKQQDWIRKERQMQRKLSELEEENRQLEQWKLEFERLKDENRSLVRVVSRLSKKD